MRHRKGFNHLGRKSEHRKAMLANMASSLIIHKRIKTTGAKAKALRAYIEPLITRSKEDTTHSRRIVFSYLKDKQAVAELFREVSPKVAERPGGYTRILKLGNRPGDNADMCIIELVDFNALLLESTQETKAKTTRRSRRGRKKSVSTETQQAPAQEETSGSEKVAGTQAAEIQKTEEAETAVEETVMKEPVDTGETGKVEQASAEEESSGEAVKKEEKQETKAEKTPEETKSEDKEESGEENKEEKEK